MAKITRAGRRRLDQIDAAWSWEHNYSRKCKERVTRAARMRTLLKGGSLPYPPFVMSWMSRELGKRSKDITPADVKSLLA